MSDGWPQAAFVRSRPEPVRPRRQLLSRRLGLVEPVAVIGMRVDWL